MKTLSLQSVSKKFGSLNILTDVSLHFQPGTVTAIVGDNGAGKSTLLKLLAGVYQPDTGTVSLGDMLLSACTLKQRRDAGIEMVYQDLALAPNQDIVTNLFLGREILSRRLLDRVEMHKQAERILSELDIKLPPLTTRVCLLSGGQQQAVAIARALLFKPQIVLLDEPTAALAPREIERILALIKMLKEQDCTVILVSHRLNDVFAVADRIVVLKHGAVLLDSPAINLTLAEVVKQIVS